MTKKTGAYILMLVGLILLILNITELDFSNLQKESFFGIISNVLLILAMIVSVRDLNKKEENSKKTDI